MATELGTAYVQIVPSAQGISGSISRAIGGEADSAGITAGQGFASKFASVASKVMVAAGIGKIIGDSISQGGELEQSIGGVETLFKDSAGKVREYASQAYRTTGLSANEYMQNVTGFSASLLQSLGGDTDKAAEIANTAMIDMADNANKMGTDMQSIQNAYQGFAKQNYTMLDNLKLGYGGTKKEMERLLSDATKLSGVEYNIDNLNDVYEAIHVIQGELDITGTTAKEASETIQGSMSAMKAAFQDVLGNLATGGDIVGPLNALGETIVTFVRDNLFPMLTNILTELPTIIVTAIQNVGEPLLDAGIKMVVDIGDGISQALPSLIPQLVTVITGLVDSFVQEIYVFVYVGIELIQAIVQGLIEAIPILIEATPKIIASLVDSVLMSIPMIVGAGIDLLSALVEGLPEIIQAIVKAIPEIVKAILDNLTSHLPDIIRVGVELFVSLIKNLPEIITQIVAAIPQIITGILNAIVESLPEIIEAGIQLFTSLIVDLPKAIVEIVARMPEIISGIVDAIADGIPDLIDVGKRLVEGLWEGIKSLGDWLWNQVSGFFGGIWDGVKDFFGIQSPSKKFAWIGEMNMRGMALGMEDNLALVSNAMDKVEEEAMRDMEPSLDLTARASYAEDLKQSGDAFISSEGNMSLDRIISLLSELSGLIEGNGLTGKVVLDSGALVGALVSKLDEALAQKQLDESFGGGDLVPVI